MRDSYLYYFTITIGDYADQVSPIGQARTTSPVNSSPDHLGTALTPYVNWESGFSSAYRDMVGNDRIDIVMCVGDYIYEYEVGDYPGKGPARDHRPAHGTISLTDYRLCYTAYCTDTDLQKAHRAKPWIVTWDDHEVANDDRHSDAENHDPETEGDYVTHHDAVIQAYLEWLPARVVLFLQGGKLYHNFRFGDLADLTMLDPRIYRDQQLKFTRAGETDDESCSILGFEQFNYLFGQRHSSSTKWRVVGNSVMFTQCLAPPLGPEATHAVIELLSLSQDGLPYNPDQWDGYAAGRRKFIDIMDKENYDNVVFLTDGIRPSWNCNVPKVPDQYSSVGIAAIGVVCASVSAPNISDTVKLPQDNPISLAVTTGLKTANPYVNYFGFDHHGYAAVYLGHEDVITEYRLVEAKEKPDRPLFVAVIY